MIAHEGILWKWLTGDGSINLAGYERTIDYSDYAILKSYAITLLYVVGNVVFGLVMIVIGAYCIFRQNKLRTFMTLFFVFSLMFNGGTVPTYMVIRTLGMTGTIWSLILPGCTNAMFIMMTMNAYKQVPYSTIESAELDGAGHFTIMFKILLPQAMGLVTVCTVSYTHLLLKIIEGTIASVPPQGGRKHPQQELIPINTQNILFICGGAFEGLDKIISSRLDSKGIGFNADIHDKNEQKVG